MARKRHRPVTADFEKLASRRCLPNRYIDIPTLTKIGLHDEVTQILQSCGWTDLLHMRDPTYPDLVREFLSEFMFIDEIDNDEGEIQEGKFRFKIGNRVIEMSLATVRELFGWFPEGGEYYTPSMENGFVAWKEMSGGEVLFDPGRSVESGMRNELYFYLHRVISCTIYGRENGQEKVSQNDFDLLYYMYKRVPVDFARLLGLRLREIRNGNGALMCGGFITRIVSGVAGINFEREYRGRLEAKLIDISMLMRMRAIQVDEEADTVEWVHYKEHVVLSLPAPPVELENQLVEAPGTSDHQSVYEKCSLAIKEITVDLDQMKKKIKSEMYRMEINMYDFFQTISPGWKPPFPPSPPSSSQRLEERSDGTSDSGEPAV